MTKKIRQILKEWYFTNKRDLPWRETSDPYKIWISEIVLQQTHVNQGIDYYIRFIERFPDVKTLADASEDEVLKYWQGLGYYSRARNLHKASKQIMANFGGKFPTTFDDVLSLSGIGTYTASAICSFAYNQNYAVLDGNVFRVLSRLFAISTPINTNAGQKEFSQWAENLLDKTNSHTHNQAIMEFGALQCVPANPNCADCPLKEHCKAHALNIVSNLPIKQGKTAVSDRYFNYFFITNNEYTYLQKRTKKDIWQNLYEFPLIETEEHKELENLMEREEFKHLFTDIQNIEISNLLFQTKHILSHRRIFATFYSVKISEENNHFQSFSKLKISEIEKFAVSRLTEIFLEKNVF